MSDWLAAEGSPFPLGATWVESAEAWNFALFSKHAGVHDRDCNSSQLARPAVASPPGRRRFPLLPKLLHGLSLAQVVVRNCSNASAPSSNQNFSVPFTRRLNCLTVDST